MILLQVEAKGSMRNMLASLGLHLRQYCQFLMLDFLVCEPILWDLINKEEISVKAEA